MESGVESNVETAVERTVEAAVKLTVQPAVKPSAEANVERTLEPDVEPTVDDNVEHIVERAGVYQPSTSREASKVLILLQRCAGRMHPSAADLIVYSETCLPPFDLAHFVTIYCKLSATAAAGKTVKKFEHCMGFKTSLEA